MRYRRHCPICGDLKIVRRRETRGLCRRCIPAYVRQTRGADYFTQMAARTAARSSEGNRKAALRRWVARYPDCPPETARQIYMGGYRAGWIQGRYHSRPRKAVA